jgi:hypothetical protein
MVPDNKQNRRYKQINFIGLQNNRHPSQHTVGNFHKDSDWVIGSQAITSFCGTYLLLAYDVMIG